MKSRQAVKIRKSSDWQNTQLGNIAYFEMGQSPSSTYVSEEEIGIPFLQGNADFGLISPTPQYYCSQPKKLCKPGDVLISVRAPVGDLNKADQIYVIGRGLAAVRFTDIPSDFGWYLLQYWAKDLERVAQGTTFRAISKGDLDALQVWLPPLAEQRRIAEILDAADAAIRETARVIAKLREVKRGLLHDLLTRGLDAQGRLRDPDAHPEQFKDSPLGQIPKAWEVKKTGDLFHMQLGKMLSKASKTGRNPFPYLANRNVQWDRADLSDLEWMDFDEFEREKYNLLAGDLLICEGGEIGRTAMWHNEMENCYYQKAIHRLRPKDQDVLPGYMLRFMHFAIGKSFFVTLTSQTSIAHLTQEKLARLPVGLPSIKEQRAIVAVFDAHDARIRAEEAVLAKRRQVKRGLMDDLLTGEVRV